MNGIEKIKVAEVFDSYPEGIYQKIMFLRQLILETVAETKGAGQLEETLKWGEPSYLIKGGSTIRIGWKKDNPDQYAMYFHCQTRLVDTFRELYHAVFTFEGNRAIIFNKADKIPINELKYCIMLALTYHSRKHLPVLGA